MSSSQLSYEGTKLYYTPHSCSFSVFTTAHQLGLKGLKLEQVDLKTHKTSSGVDFYTINPKGNVPCLVFPDGSTIIETAVALQFMADQKPSEALIGGAHGSKERYQVLNALNLVATEMHPAVGGLFALNDSNKEFLHARLTQKLTYLNKLLSDRQFLANNKYSIADTYMYVVTTWLAFFPQIDLKPYENVTKYSARIAALPHIKAAKEAAEKNLASL